MAETPSAGDAAKQEKKDTVRITLPPRPVPPSSAGAAPAGTSGPAKLAATVAAMPIVPKKETARLKKTTGSVPGATKPAAPVVPPPTVRAQPVGQVPSTVAAAPMPPPPAPTATSPAAMPVPSSASTAVARPTVKLQTADIPKIPSPPPSAAPSAPASMPVPAPVGSSGPTLLDAVLSVVVMIVSGVAVWLLLKAHLG
ncbi:MAG: hypothetical protein NT105_00855 [Verrucomicrobia bacterium]|nr:hypothetical protein [Verrucomicrobiota bacterium]